MWSCDSGRHGMKKQLGKREKIRWEWNKGEKKTNWKGKEKTG